MSIIIIIIIIIINTVISFEICYTHTTMSIRTIYAEKWRRPVLIPLSDSQLLLKRDQSQVENEQMKTV